MIDEGQLVGFPVVGINVVLTDGASHSVDSSDNAFQAACRGAFREAYPRSKPILLEPVMNVSLEGPSEFQGEMLRTVMQRRGIIIGTTDENEFVRIDSEVPLSEMFGYATALRSATQGKAEFTMEFARYAPVPKDLAQEKIEEIRKAKAEKEGKNVS
jgi:elongation factor G